MHINLDPILAISPDWTFLPQVLFPPHLDSSIDGTSRSTLQTHAYTLPWILYLQLHLCFISQALSSSLGSLPLLPRKMDLCICSPSSAGSANGRSQMSEQKCYIVMNKCNVVKLVKVASVLNNLHNSCLTHAHFQVQIFFLLLLSKQYSMTSISIVFTLC